MTKNSIGKVCNELRLALIEDLEASQAVVDAEQRKAKAHYRLRLARNAVYYSREDYEDNKRMEKAKVSGGE